LADVPAGVKSSGESTPFYIDGESMSLITVLNQIKGEEIVLPAIQRDFVWEEDRIVKLLDSIMRGYPIGLALLWETYQDLQYRVFVKDFKTGQTHTFHENSKKRRIKVVLDGQQRLQSLFIALYGTYEGRALYFDVLSGRDSEDLAEDKFLFDFMTTEKSKTVSESKKTKNGQAQHFAKVGDLFAMGARERQQLKKDISIAHKLPEDEQNRLDLNLAQFEQTFLKDQNILKLSTIDEDLPSGSPSRKSEADVLEIFVRVNREGTPLSRSDLIFSMLKLNWKESAEDLPAFVRRVNQGNAFELDNDFVIRCLFAVSELGTKFDLDLLRKRHNADALRSNFGKCCAAIESTLDFVQSQRWCGSSSILGGPNTLVPLVYHLFHTRKHEPRNDQISNIRKSLYLFGFARPFSRYSDSRLWKFIREELKPLAD